MKSKLTKMLLGATVALSIATPVFASQKYEVTVPLPKRGSYKVATRKATGEVQYTYVLNNNWDVNGRIIMDNGVALTTYKTHKRQGNPYNGYEQKQLSGVGAGTKIKAEFKTTKFNYLQTSGTLGWRP